MKNDIDKEMWKVIKGCAIEGNRVTLPDDRYSAEFKEEMIRAMDRLKGKWRISLRAFDFDYDPKAMWEEMSETGMFPIIGATDYCDTPPRIVAMMLDKVPAGTKRFLEPSAGEGNIVKGIMERFHGSTVHAIETNLTRWAKLKKINTLVAIQQDFLTLRQTRGYECVLMHPPFATARNPLEYVDHFHHAFNLLVEGGLLISLAPYSLGNSEDGKVKGLRNMISVNNGVIEPLSPRTLRAGDCHIPAVLVCVGRGRRGG